MSNVTPSADKQDASLSGLSPKPVQPGGPAAATSGRTTGPKAPVTPVNNEAHNGSEPDPESEQEDESDDLLILGQTSPAESESVVVPSDLAAQAPPPVMNVAQESVDDSTWMALGALALGFFAAGRNHGGTTPPAAVTLPEPKATTLDRDSVPVTEVATHVSQEVSDLPQTPDVPEVEALSAPETPINAGAIAFPSHPGGVLHEVAANETLQSDTTAQSSDYKLSDVAPKIESIEYGYTNFYALNPNNPFYDAKYVNYDHIFHPNDEMYFKVAFTDNVYVTGAPQLKLSIGGVDRYAELSSGSGTQELWFKYTVQDADHDLNGIAVTQDALLKNGGSIADAQGHLLQGFEAGNFGLNAPVDFNTPDQTLNITAAGLSRIDLGAVGDLIKPVQVEGKWYYLLDVNKDGALDARDMLTHDKLEEYFTQTLSDQNGGIDTTNDKVHYGWFAAGDSGEMIRASLPIRGGGAVSVPVGQKWGNKATAVDSPTELNPQYDDVLAIWDAFNQSGSAAPLRERSGIPDAWRFSALEKGAKVWTSSAWAPANPTPDAHIAFTLSTGKSVYLDDTDLAYVLFQVL